MLMLHGNRVPSDRTTAVVICCYTDKRWHYLRQAILSALNQSLPAAEVIVVVDHNPALAKRLKDEAFIGLLVVENTHPKGLSGARNTGIENSSSALILFLDDDAVADADLLFTFAIRMDEQSVLGAVATIRPQWENGRPSWFPDEFLWTVGCTYRGLYPGPVRNLIGAAMCVRRTVFNSVGGFDAGLGRTAHSLPLGCEETEFCIRANKALPNGYFVFEASSGCDHAIPAQRSTLGYFVRRCWAEGLSKASVSTLAGAKSALSSEASYLIRTLPAGLRLGLSDFFLGGKPSGILRTLAILAGLTCTVLGFVIGRARGLYSAFHPTLILNRRTG